MLQCSALGVHFNYSLFRSSIYMDFFKDLPYLLKNESLTITVLSKGNKFQIPEAAL